MSLPTKEEIRQKYGIIESDFEILETSHEPSPQDLKNAGARLEKLGFWGKFEVWAKKSILGNVILAIIFIGGFINGSEMIYKYGSIVYSNKEQISSYVDHFQDYAKDQAKTFLVYLGPNPTEEDEKKQMETNIPLAIIPTGSNIYPYPYSYRI